MILVLLDIKLVVVVIYAYCMQMHPSGSALGLRCLMNTIPMCGSSKGTGLSGLQGWTMPSIPPLLLASSSPSVWVPTWHWRHWRESSWERLVFLAPDFSVMPKPRHRWLYQVRSSAACCSKLQLHVNHCNYSDYNHSGSIAVCRGQILPRMVEHNPQRATGHPTETHHKRVATTWVWRFDLQETHIISDLQSCFPMVGHRLTWSLYAHRAATNGRSQISQLILAECCPAEALLLGTVAANFSFTAAVDIEAKSQDILHLSDLDWHCSNFRLNQR